MAAPRDQEIRLVATDKASKVIEKVADQLEDLEKQGDAAIEITADDKATAEIRSISQRLAGLSDEDKTIVIKAQVGDAEKDVARILRSLSRIDEMDDEEIKIRVDALGNARDRLDEVQRELADLDGETATVKVEAKGLDDLSDKLGAMPGQLGDLTGALSGAGGLAGGAAAVGVALVAAADAAADMAIEAQTMSTLTGDTVEDASRLQAVWKTTGADVNDLNDVVLQMVGVLQTSPDLAAKLGINLKDGATGGQRFVEVMEKIDKFSGSAAEKSQLMSQLLGEEGARQGAKFLAIVDDIGEAMEDVDETQIISDEDVDAAVNMKREFAEMKTALTGVVTTLGQELVPLLGGAATIANSINAEMNAPDRSAWGDALAQAMAAVNPVQFAKEIQRAWGEIGGDVELDVSVGPNIAGLPDTMDDATASTRDYTAAGLEARDAMVAQVNAKLDEQMGELADETERAAAAAERHAQALQDEYDRQTAIADAFRTGADAQRTAAETQEAWNTTIAGYGDAVAEAGDDQAKLTDIVNAGTDAAIANADATKAAYTETAKQGGIILKASDQTAIFNSKMLEQASTASGPLRRSILDYTASVNGIPESVLTEIEAALAAGDIELANRLLNEASRKREAEIAAETTGVETAEQQLNRLARERNARIVVQTSVRGVGMVDAGGTVGREGGIAAEIGPEFAQLPGGRKVLLTQPSFVPPGTRVTSRVETARQLGLKRYDNGTGLVLSGGGTTIIHEHITLNAGVIGNGFDVERKVAQSLRQYERRNGRRRP